MAAFSSLLSEECADKLALARINPRTPAVRHMPALDTVVLIQAQEFHANGGGNADHFTRGGKFPGLLIDVKDDDVVRLLVFGEQEVSRRVDFKAARFLAVGGGDFGQRESAFRGIDGIDGDAVVAAVGSVQKFARGMDFDFGVVILSVETLWKR